MGSPCRDVTLPSLPDQDNSWAEMQSRIDKTIHCLKALRPDQLDGKDDSDVTVPLQPRPRLSVCISVGSLGLSRVPGRRNPQRK
jgi:hypothetical protein